MILSHIEFDEELEILGVEKHLRETGYIWNLSLGFSHVASFVN